MANLQRNTLAASAALLTALAANAHDNMAQADTPPCR